MEFKRVVYTCMNDLSLFGGVETIIPQEVSWLNAQGLEVHILSPPPKKELRFAPNDRLRLFHFPNGILGYPWLVRDFMSVIWMASKCRRIAKNGRLVSVSFSAIDAMGPALAKLTGSDVRMVLRVVGPLSFEVEHFATVKRPRYRIYSQLFRLVEAFVYLVADAILPVSEFELDSIRAYGIDGTKVRLVRCGVDSSKYGGRKNKRTLIVPIGSKVVMFVGRFVEKNGPLVIADAVDGVIRRFPQVCFVFVGDGPLRETLNNKLANHIMAGRALFTGFRSDVADLHAEADVYVGHVSSKVDGLGQTVFEAMMSGLAVVAGDDPISRKIITSGKNGILVPKDNPRALEEALVDLLKDDARRAELGAAARRTAEEELSFDSAMRAIVQSWSEP